MTILVTGCAGFIGSHVTLRLLERGEEVVGIDDLNAYYDPALKQARLRRLDGRPGFTFVKGDIAATADLEAATRGRRVDRVVHLAAQAGVRYSLDNPRAYARSNLNGHLEVLELCRHLEVRHLVYASSSSVYGGNTKVPFHESDPVDQPVSLYAATKRADELISHTYTHLFGIPQTGLRFFTVYGPWGRPDMAYWLFTEAILEGRPIRVFNQGEMWRDFTYIDDVVTAVLAVLDAPPAPDAPRQRTYNIGHSRPEKLGDMIALLERLLGRTAIREYAPMQPGDVERTYASVEALERDFGVAPKIDIDEGLAEFVRWYREYRHLG